MGEQLKDVLAAPVTRVLLVLVVAQQIGAALGSLAATGLAGVRWGQSPVDDALALLGAVLGTLVAGVLLRPGELPAAAVRAEPQRSWPGPRLGAVALVAAPLLLLAGEAVRMGHFYYYPAQLAAMATDRTTILVSYGLFTLGLLALVPAFLALAAMIAVREPGWAFWGATAAVLGTAVRLFQDGIGFLALHLVDVQGLDTATHAVTATYQSWYVLYPLTFLDNIGWALLAVGAVRAGVLGWLPAAGVAIMLTHSSGVLKGSAVNSLVATALLAAALVPLGVAAWRAAPPVSRAAWRGGWVAAAALVALYAYHLLVEV
ncbi:hypothetical protein ACQEVB_18240 [Pseudonocardia sp. CA-107938]|uniref:hypothetical protein n=1 Tax=Pseudonocardia sp. CA-107938 TaxID=3240021 RepID=UPI003D8FC212